MKITVNDELKKDYPYLCKYIEKYGSDLLPSTYEIPPRFKKNIDQFYKYCLDEGKKWNEIVKVKEGIIL